jgi:hypothetical protein
MVNPSLVDTKKEIQGSGKAAFPGEKRITDESPRMEEEDLDDDDELELKEESDDLKITEEVDITLNFKNQDELFSEE